MLRARYGGRGEGGRGGDVLPDLDGDVEGDGRGHRGPCLCRLRVVRVGLLLLRVRVLLQMRMWRPAGVGRWQAPVRALGVGVEVVRLPGGRIDLGAPALQNVAP